jgi:L-alanine-DL-glutamate epimerase-like enolase superfamily enzyme
VNDMPITAIECVESKAPRRPGDETAYVVVRTPAADGWYGPVPAAVARTVRQTMAPRMIGLDALDAGAIRPIALGLAQGRVSAVSSWALGAIDCALWDARGNLAQTPVADLLSPHAVQRVPAYASWLTCDLADRRHTRRIARVSAGEWAFAKWSLRARPTPHTSREAARLAHAIEGHTRTGVKIALDAQGSWGAAITSLFSELVSPDTLAWCEDPLSRHDLSAYRHLARAGVKMALGERLRVGEDARALLDAARPAGLVLDIVGCGGLTTAMEIARLAHSRGVPVYPHGRSLIPGIHLAAAFPAAVRAVEYRLQWEPRRQRQMTCPRLPAHGHLTVPREPGLSARPRRLR